MRKSIVAFAAALALPLQAPALSQAPAQIALDRYQPIAGAWSYRATAGGSEASFADSTATPRLSVRCNRAARTVSIARTGVPAAAPTLSIWTSSATRSVPSRFDATKALTADLAASDPLLDALAFTRGRFATAAAGAPMLTLPSSPEVIRVIEDCRT
ncbi:MAG: hypothetical protein ACLGHC_04375 [Alphaproteobacteria bacterium]